jgi:hypothetical protein
MRGRFEPLAGQKLRVPVELRLAAERAARSRWTPYAVPALLAAAAVQTWFRFGTVLASGDISPPFAPSADYRSLWNDVSNGAGAVSRDIIWLPYYEGIRLLGPEAFQRLFFTASFSLAAVAAVYFARGLGLRPATAGLAGFFAVFNPYFLTNTLFPVPRLTLAATGLLGGIALRVARDGVTVRRCLAFALVTLITSLAFTNPPGVYLIGIGLAIAVVAAFARFGLRALTRLSAFAAIVAVPTFLVNLWWLVPTWLSLRGTDARPVAAAGPLAWAWTDRRASLGNILGLSTTWAWPESYRFAHSLDRFPMSVLHYSLPVLALTGVVTTRGRLRRVFAVLVVCAVALVIAIKGLHPPFVELNVRLYAHFPGYWLLREPEKALVLLALIFAVFAAAGTTTLVRSRRFGEVGTWAALVLVVGSIAYLYPVYTGTLLHSTTHVHVPDDYARMKKLLAASPAPGKVLVLPVPDFYQLPFRWHYYGVPFWGNALGRPVLSFDSASYQRPDPTVKQLVANIQDVLLANDGRSITQQLHTLGASFVLVSRDVDTSLPNRQLASPALLRRRLLATPGIRHVATYGELDLFAVASPSEPVLAARPAHYQGPPWLYANALAATPSAGYAVVDGGAGAAGATTRFVAPAGTATLAVERSAGEVTARWADGVGRTFATAVPSSALVTVDGRPLRAGTGVGRARVTSGSARLDVLAPTRPRAASSTLLPGNCPAVAGRLIAGAVPPRVAGVQSGCLMDVLPLPAHTAAIRFGPGARASGFLLCLAPGGGACKLVDGANAQVPRRVPRRARFAYLLRDVTAADRPPFPRAQTFAASTSLVLNRPPLVVASGSVATAADVVQRAQVRCPVRGKARAPIADGQALVLEARQPFSGCVALGPLPTISHGYYRLSFLYRSSTGSTVTLCVREEPAGRCLSPHNPAKSRTWRYYEIVFRAQPGTRSLQTLVALEAGRKPKEFDLRGLELRRLAGHATLTRSNGPAPPSVRVVRVAPTDLRVHVDGAHGPFVLVLQQAWARGWTISVPWHGAKPRHVHANGYANGWLISRQGSYDVTLHYGVATWADGAKTLDLVLVPLFLLGWLGLVGRDVRDRRRPQA